MNIAQRLKEIREKRGYTQTETAKGIETKVTIYARWERGQNIPDTKNIIKLCKFLKVSADYLLGLSEDEET